MHKIKLPEQKIKKIIKTVIILLKFNKGFKNIETTSVIDILYYINMC